MSEIDFQNGFICGLATKGLTVNSGDGQSEPTTMTINGQTEESYLFRETIAKHDPVVIVNQFSDVKNPQANGSSTGANDMKWSPDGNYIAVLTSLSPYILIYKKTGELFATLTWTPTANSNAYGVTWSPDSLHLAVVSSGTSLSIYKRNGDTFTKLTNPTTLPAGVGYCVAYNPSGTHMAVGSTSSPFVTIYSISGDVYTKLANPSILPTGACTSISYNLDGTELMLGGTVSPRLYKYTISGDTYTSAAAPETVGYTVWSIDFNSVLNHMAIGFQTAAGNCGVHVFTISGGTYTLLSNFTTKGYIKSVTYSKDGKYLAILSDSDNGVLSVFEINGSNYTLISSSNFNSIPMYGYLGVDFSPNSQYLAVGNLDIYKIGASNTFARLGNPDVRLTSSGTDIAINKADDLVAAGMSAAPYVKLYKHENGTLTMLPNLATPPSAGDANIVVAFGENPEHMAISNGDTSPRICLYKRNGDTFDRLSNPSVLPNSKIKSMEYSKDGKFLILALTSYPYIMAYIRDGDTYIQTNIFDTLPQSTAFYTQPEGISISGNSQYLAVITHTSPYVLIYKRTGDSFNKLTTVSTIFPSDGWSVEFDETGDNLVYSGMSSGNCIIYKKTNDGTDYLQLAINGSTSFQATFSNDNKKIMHTNTDGIGLSQKVGDIFISQFTTKTSGMSLMYGLKRSVINKTDEFIFTATTTFPNNIYITTVNKLIKSADNLIDVLQRASKIGYAKESGNAGERHNVIITHQGGRKI